MEILAFAVLFVLVLGAVGYVGWLHHRSRTWHGVTEAHVRDLMEKLDYVHGCWLCKDRRYHVRHQTKQEAFIEAGEAATAAKQEVK